MTEEQKVQAKIRNYLQAAGFIVIKIIVASTSGEPDLIACGPDGRFWAVEVKTETGRLTKLQEAKLNLLAKNGARAFVAYGYADFLKKFEAATNKSTGHVPGL